ncbi:hypothetical protein LINPERHAP2_LOCUS14011, partial [Linum perenne]
MNQSTHPSFHPGLRFIFRSRRHRRLWRATLFVSHPNRLVISRPHQVWEVELSLGSPHLKSGSVISQSCVFTRLVSSQPYPCTV